MAKVVRQDQLSRDELVYPYAFRQLEWSECWLANLNLESKDLESCASHLASVTQPLVE
jgi:hypothetical protein